MPGLRRRTGIANLRIDRFSCKVFFIRVSTAGAKVVKCQNDHRCHPPSFRGIGKSKCVACRYEKCVKVGMIPEITARRRGCTLRERRAQVGLRKKGRKLVQEEEEDDQVPSTSSAPDSREVQLAAKKFTKPIFSLPAVSLETISTLVKLEDLIMNDDPSFSVVIDFAYSLDESLADALQNPLLVGPRVPLGMHPSTGNIPLEFLPTLGARVFTRVLVLLADWCRAMPEFWEIDQEDRTILFARQFMRQNIFKDYYYTYKYKHRDAVLFTFGNLVKLKHLQVHSNLAGLYDLRLTGGLGFVIPLMNRVEMGDEEFVLLKNIILFSSGMGLKERTVEVVKKAFNKYSNILLEYLKFRYDSEALAVERFMAIMEIPRHLQSMSIKTSSVYGKTVLLQEGALCGSLPKEILWKL